MDKYFIERFNMCAKGLNQRLSQYVLKIPDHIKAHAQEIHIRINKPVSIYCGNITYYLTANNQLISCGVCLDNDMLIATQHDVYECFQNICCYSVYTRQSEIKNGFITMRGGHRAGICGTAVYMDNTLANMRDISSINLRIAKEIKGIAKPLLRSIDINKGGILLCGIPSSGKTTVLRDISRILSTKENKKICIVDERGEIAGSYSGVPQNDIGFCDVLDGYMKADGIMQALRCMSPQIVVCDEIGTEREAKSIESCLNSGVTVIASLHCANICELMSKPQARMLLSANAFAYVGFLSDRIQPGVVKEIYTIEELKIYEANRLHTADNKHHSHRVLSVSNDQTEDKAV